MSAKTNRLSPFRLWGIISILLTAMGTVYLHDGIFSNWLTCWLVSINASTLVIFGIDKLKAQRGWLRIPEDILLGMVLIGGTAGAIVAMVLFRHKVSKGSFMNSFWTAVILQIVLVCIWYFIFS